MKGSSYSLRVMKNAKQYHRQTAQAPALPPIPAAAAVAGSGDFAGGGGGGGASPRGGGGGGLSLAGGSTPGPLDTPTQVKIKLHALSV